MSAQTALVTGAAGFVGANLVRRLLADGHEVHAAVRPGSDRWRLAGVESELRVCEVDLREREEVERTVAATAPEWVFHLAAHGAYSSQTDVHRIVATNLEGTVNLLEACLAAGCEAFVNSGSSSEYGLKDHPPAESEPLEPNSDYAVAKAAATMYCRHTARSRDAQVVTLRLYSAYGPWEEPTRLVPTLASRALAGELPPLVSPSVARDFVYVDDVVDAYLTAAGSAAPRGAVYNVGTGVQTTIAELVEVARRELDVEAEPRWGSMAERSWDTDVWVSDPGLIRAELGWRHRHDVAAGFAATVAWLQEDPERRRTYREAG